MNTQDDSISRDELAEPAKKVVDITRAALVDKLVDHRTDDFDSHDIEEAVRCGRYGYEELPNDELEDLADEWGLEENGEEVRYKITDADAKPLAEDLVVGFSALAQHIASMADDSYLTGHPEWVLIAHEAQAMIAKAEGR